MKGWNSLFLISPTELDTPIPLGILYFPLEDLILHFLRPVRWNHPYLIYSRIIFDTIGETFPSYVWMLFQSHRILPDF